MARVLITGMSGTGKSSVIQELARRGFAAIDTDSDAWCHWTDEPRPDWIWREDRIRALLAGAGDAPLFLAGCKSNQGVFYGLLDHVVLLTAPLDVLLWRVMHRTNNPYGRRESERREIVEYTRTVEPLLRRRATLELDTSTLSVPDVADRLVALAVGAEGVLSRP